MATDDAANQKPRVVVVGGGFGGLEAARTLRDAPVRVTLIDRTNHHLFQPLLYQVATAGLSPADIAAPIRNILRRQPDAEVVMAEVTGVDKAGRRVLMGDRSIDYDYLIIASGARDGYFGHPEWERFAPGLKSIPQATEIRRNILLAFEQAEVAESEAERTALLTFVLVGGGPTGVEMSGAIGELAHKALATDFRRIDPRMARIVLIEAGPRILSTFSEDLSRRARQALERLGVEVREHQRVEQIDAEGVVVAGERIASRNVIWSAGVRASPAGEWLGVETDKQGRVRVLDDCRIPDFPEIFVIGDTMTTEQDGKPLPGVAPVAIQQGHYVATAIIHRIQGESGEGPFRYFDKGNLATVGRAFAVLEAGKIRLSGLIAWLAWMVVHIFFLIGFRNRVVVLIQWAWAYVSYQRGARLITVPMPEPEAAPVPAAAASPPSAPAQPKDRTPERAGK
jgi:NADH:ubiquinone reductase (H+-translocating)